VDFEPNRLIDVFDTVTTRDRKLPHVTSPSNLVSIYYNMGKLWHQYFDFIFPLYLTLSMSGSFDINRVIFVPKDWFFAVPQIANALSNNGIRELKGPLFWDEVTFGMVKLTDLRQSKVDPPYSFPENCTQPLRMRVLSYFNISGGKPALVFLRRKGIARQIENVDEFAAVLKRMRPDLEFVDVFFENVSAKFQVELLSRARIFVSVHGSGLSNLLWMEVNTVVVEIMPHWFKHDWFRKAAGAAGVRHFWFEADKVKGMEEKKEVRECKQSGVDRRKQPCSDFLRDQNVQIDIGRFDRELGMILREV
jgi:hypothetical protein